MNNGWQTGIPTWFVDQTLADTLTDLRVYTRDVWLVPSVLALYHPGQVLRSPAAVKATSLVGGMRTSHRFTILSNHMVDVGALFHDERLLASGQHAADAGSRFLVIDVFETRGKTQILLLHLPDDERWELFRPSEPEPADRLVEAHRQRFAHVLGLPVPDELDDDWLTTCYDPVGVDEDKRPFELEEPLGRRLRFLGDLDFRTVAGHLVYLGGAREALCLGEQGFGDEGVYSAAYPDAVCWAYLDRSRGLVLRAFKAARLDRSGRIVTCDGLDGLRMELVAGEVLDRECAPVIHQALAECAEEIGRIHDARASYDDAMAPVRAIRSLDQFRSRNCPDNVRARLASRGRIKAEITWLRTEAVDEDGSVMARLLIEPAQDCGAHMGDLLRLDVTNTADGPACLAFVDE